MKIIECSNIEDYISLSSGKKSFFEDVRLNEQVKSSIRSIFGSDLSASEVVERIVNDVREFGDEKVFLYTRLLDNVDLSPSGIKVNDDEINEAFQLIDDVVLQALRQAADNIRQFHLEQMPKTWCSYRGQGSIVGQQVTPLARVGIYVPGGTASYPSSVIMNAVPAKVAGVKEIIMAVPPGRDGKIDPNVLCAASISGVTGIYKVGGAQAIAALAYGTESIPKVDKITGPGNIFVTLAKKMVYGTCDIDMLAGPSEVLIIADKDAEPAFIAADLLSQAEHDPLSSSVLITDCKKLAENVLQEVSNQIKNLKRRDIARQSLKNSGCIYITPDIMTAIDIANMIAPEHIEIMVQDPLTLLPFIKNAGSIFLGTHSPEPLGDYLAGPNHVLPTGGTARFYSALNVETFMKKSNFIYYTAQALSEVSDSIITLAKAEGLDGHAGAIAVRQGVIKNAAERA